MNLGFLGKGNASRPDGAATSRSRPAPAASSCTRTGARRRRRSTTAWRVADETRRAGRDPHRHAQRSRASSRTPSPPSRAARSTPSTPKAPAAATRPTSSSVAGEANVLPVVDQPDPAVHRQHARRAPRHADGLPPPRPAIAEDLAFAESRIRRETIAAEDILHDLGAISHDVVRLPGDGPRRRGDHPHLADGGQDEGAARRAAAATRERNDNFRVKRYVAKYTINPAIAHGIAARGRLDRGRQARRPVLWKPAFFGVKPALVLKGGIIASARDGRPERLDPDAAAGALPADVRRLRRRARASSSHLRLAGGARAPACRAGSACAAAASRCAARARHRQARHGAQRRHAAIEVDPETYEVRADGELLTCEPATVLPMAQRYFLF